MQPDEQIKTLEKLLVENTGKGFGSLFIPTVEFFRVYVGESSHFYLELEKIGKITPSFQEGRTKPLIRAYISYLKNGLSTSINYERRIRTETVNDYLEQADDFINDKDVHPSIPCSIIGASLEEFLRTWVESLDDVDDENRLTIDSYSKILRSRDLITKQEAKEITVWAGLRNSAAHGVWTEVDDRQKINNMLQGVNLFIRKYTV